jgi:hypothetical protein
VSGFVEEYALRLSELENVEYHSTAQAPWRGYLFSIKGDSCPDVYGNCVCWLRDPEVSIFYIKENREADRIAYKATKELSIPIFPWQGAKCTVS